MSISFRDCILKKIFYRNRALLSPHLDCWLITLGCSAFRFLSAVLDGTQETTTMRWMITHPKFLLDHLGHSRCGPDLPSKLEAFSPPRQQCGQLRQLLRPQFRRGTRPGLMPPRLCSLSCASVDLLADRSFCNFPGPHHRFFFPS